MVSVICDGEYTEKICRNALELYYGMTDKPRLDFSLVLADDVKTTAGKALGMNATASYLLQKAGTGDPTGFSLYPYGIFIQDTGNKNLKYVYYIMRELTVFYDCHEFLNYMGNDVANMYFHEDFETFMVWSSYHASLFETLFYIETNRFVINPDDELKLRLKQCKSRLEGLTGGRAGLIRLAKCLGEAAAFDKGRALEFARPYKKFRQAGELLLDMDRLSDAVSKLGDLQQAAEAFKA